MKSKWMIYSHYLLYRQNYDEHEVNNKIHVPTYSRFRPLANRERVKGKNSQCVFSCLMIMIFVLSKKVPKSTYSL